MMKVLVLCTGNSCRSVMAEGLLNHWGAGRIRAFSAGSNPTGRIHPVSIATLERHGLPTVGYRSKSWSEFANHPLDLVITVCDSAANETCPNFPGIPVKAHWGVPDPAHAQGAPDEIAAEFSRVYALLEKMVKALVALPLESMSSSELSSCLANIRSDAR